MIVMKFGGTSVQDAAAIKRVIEIVRGRLGEHPLVVVSAMSKVTRRLVALAEEAESKHSDNMQSILDELKERHRAAASELLSGDDLKETLSKLNEAFDSLSSFAEGVCQIGELSDRSRARIVSTGEILSSLIVGAAMNASGVKCRMADARGLIVTDDNYTSAGVRSSETQANIARGVPALAKGVDIVLTQGFIASTSKGETSLLGFEGSDYSAAIFGAALGAVRVEIWTDVDGVRTADPRIVPSSVRIDRLSYEEAAEMAFLGARVLHPLTIGPAKERNIPILVLNSTNPTGDGTAVVMEDGAPEGPKSIAYRDDIDYVEVNFFQTNIAAEMSRLSEIFLLHGIRLSLVGISGSKASFTFDSSPQWAAEAYSELLEIGEVSYFRDKAQISVVGKGVGRMKGLTDKILGAVEGVRMLTFGSDLMSVSVVTDREGLEEKVRSLHAALFGCQVSS